MHLVAAAQADQLSAHLKAAGWTAARGAGGMAVHVLPAPGCRTEGEALRLVEERDVIKGDFVLLTGAAAANADLRPVVQAHLARRAADRQAIMTLVMHGGRTGGGAAAPLAAHDRCLAVLDPRSLQLLKLEPGSRGAPASLSTQLLGERNSIAVRLCLLSAGRGASACKCLPPQQSTSGSQEAPAWLCSPPATLLAGALRPAPGGCICVRARRAHAAERQL